MMGIAEIMDADIAEIMDAAASDGDTALVTVCEVALDVHLDVNGGYPTEEAVREARGRLQDMVDQGRVCPDCERDLWGSETCPCKCHPYET